MYMYDISEKTKQNFHVICEKLIWHLIPLTVVWYQRRKDIYIVSMKLIYKKIYKFRGIFDRVNCSVFKCWCIIFPPLFKRSFIHNWIWIKLRLGLLVDLRDNIHCIKYCKSADFAIAYIYDLQFISLGKGDCVYLLCLFSNHDFTDI